MPAGYSSRCKVCNSQHRAQIEAWSKEEGLSPRAISARLKSEYGVSIGYKSVWQHLRDHFDVRSEAREQYQKSRQQMQQLVEKQLSDIEMLNRVAIENFELSRATGAWLAKFCHEKTKAPPLSLVNLHEKLTAEMRQAIKQKAELLGEDPQSRLAEAFQTLWDDGDEDMDA